MLHVSYNESIAIFGLIMQRRAWGGNGTLVLKKKMVGRYLFSFSLTFPEPALSMCLATSGDSYYSCV